MIIKWYLLLSVIVGLCHSTGAANNLGGRSVPRVELVASDVSRPGLFPGARTYAASLHNSGLRAIRLEVIKLPPGYGGGETLVYPCSLQFWNSVSHRWYTLHPNKLSDHGPNVQIIRTEIKPNEEIEVCRRLVLRQESKGGKCARFALSFRWDHRPGVLSNTFRIPDPNHPSKTHRRCPQ